MNATVKRPTIPATGKNASAVSSTTGTKKPPPNAAAAVEPAKKVTATSIKKAAPTTPNIAAENAVAGVKKLATAKRAVTGTASKVRPENVQSGKHMSSNNAKQGSGVKIDQTAVLKVSEVATKTPKSASSTTADGTLLLEVQIVKMGEKDYMNTAQLAFFKARLQQLEKDLLKNAGETTEHLRETVLVPDPADRATIEEEHALELRTRDRERKLLKKVQQSIASIDTGDYGWCEETGEPIGIPRLLARPTATLSLEAQQRRELKQKLYGD